MGPSSRSWSQYSCLWPQFSEKSCSLFQSLEAERDRQEEYNLCERSSLVKKWGELWGGKKGFWWKCKGYCYRYSTFSDSQAWRSSLYMYVCKSVNHSWNAEILIPIKDVDSKYPLQFKTQSELNKVICWWIIATLCCESNYIDFKKGTTYCEKCCEMNAFETFCHFVCLIELSTATHNILQESIDLTLSLLVTLSNVVIVWVWRKTNKGSNWSIWKELLVPNNGSLSPTIELQQWSVTSMWPEETISSPLTPWKWEVWPMSSETSKNEAKMSNKCFGFVTDLTWEV